MMKVAGELGLPFGERKMTYNSRLAQELAKWAESQGKGDEFHDAVFRAYFVDGKNIASADVLAGLAHSLGLSEKAAREVLQTRAFREAVDADWALAGSMGISAVPTFVLDHQTAVGAQPYEVLEKFLLDGGVSRR
jgi:predicted DsbA family dithiol-disulfide isomerase